MTATLTSPRPGAPAHTDKVLVNYEVRDGLAIITLDDPPANTYTYEMMRQLDEAILKARFDDDVARHRPARQGREVLLRRREHRDAQRRRPRASSTSSACTPTRRSCRLEQTPKLVIAALNGHTVGGGLEIAMAARPAHRPQGRRQDRPARGHPRRAARAPAAPSALCRLIGKSTAIELMVTGETFSFEEAEELGLVNQVFDATDELLGAGA